MAIKRVTDKDVLNINILFLQYKNKAEVARQTGFSASTIAKYIIPNFSIPSDEATNQKIEEPEIDLSIFRIDNWDQLTLLTIDENIAIKELRKEALL